MVDPRSLGVYVVTSATLVPGRSHLDVARAAVGSGATAVQLRAPELEDEALLEVATAILEVCRGAGVLFFVNDRLDVAVKSGADGVHLGQLDEPEAARERLGAGPILGVSVNRPGQARAAERAGADYLGVTIWTTATKPVATPAGITGLRRIAAATPLPVVGIGGITADNAAEVLAAGAAGVAVLSAVAGAADPAAATRELADAVRAVNPGRSGRG